MAEPKQESLDKMWKYVRGFAEKSGTTMHPNPAVTEAVVKGLAMHVDELGKRLCPCNIYPDKQAETKLRRWICACDEMQIYKYCHCLLFVREDGLPITEYLPEDHEGREIYGVVTDPAPEKGRALRHKVVQSPPRFCQNRNQSRNYPDKCLTYEQPQVFFPRSTRVAGDSKHSRL